MAPTKATKEKFFTLPNTDTECAAVDTENGLWIKCSTCDSCMNTATKRPFNMIATKKPFNTGRWNEHKQTDSHTKTRSILERSRLEERERNGTITRLELGQLNHQFRKKQRILPFNALVPAVPVQATAATTMTAAAMNTTVARSTTMTTTTTTTTTIASSTTTPKSYKTCEGVLPTYRSDNDFQRNLTAYLDFCAIDSGSDYKAGRVEWNSCAQVFAIHCLVIEVAYDKTRKVFQCCECSALR